MHNPELKVSKFNNIASATIYFWETKNKRENLMTYGQVARQHHDTSII